MNTKLSARELTITGGLIALSYLLTFIQIPFNPAFGLKIDFALVPIVIIVVLINRNLGFVAIMIDFILAMFRDPSGWLFNAFASFYFITALFIMLYVTDRLKADNIVKLGVSLVVATIVTTILMTLTNYFFLIPLLFPGFVLSFNDTAVAYVPFNFVKFALISAVSLIIIPQISKYIKN